MSRECAKLMHVNKIMQRLIFDLLSRKELFRSKIPLPKMIKLMEHVG